MKPEKNCIIMYVRTYHHGRYPADLQPKVAPEDGGWNQKNLDKVCAEIRAIQARGGLKKLLGDDGKMRQFISAVDGNAVLSDKVYDAVGSGVANDPCYPQFLQLADAIRHHLAQDTAGGGAKPTQVAMFKDQPLKLHAAAKKAKPKFDQRVKVFARKTGGKHSLAKCKKAARSCEKVLSDYNNDWTMLTDIVRASVVYVCSLGVHACVLVDPVS